MTKRTPPETHRRPGPPKGTPRPPRKPSLQVAELPVGPVAVMSDTLLEERPAPLPPLDPHVFMPTGIPRPADVHARNGLLLVSAVVTVLIGIVGWALVEAVLWSFP